MKVLSKKPYLLSNYEVYTHLKEIKEASNWGTEEELKKKLKRQSACGVDLEVITKDILQYLEGIGIKDVDSQETFKTLLVYLSEFDLMKIERLQIANSLPRSMVQLYAIIEECDQRFDETVCEGFLNKINELFPRKDIQVCNEDISMAIDK